MGKIEKDIKLDYKLDWCYGIEINQLKKDIEELEKLGATHVDIENYESYGCSYIEINGICRRLETDEEFEQRKKERENELEQRKQIELKQLAELKSKYNV